MVRITIKVLGRRSGSGGRLGPTSLVCLVFNHVHLSASTGAWRRSWCVFLGCFATIREALNHRLAILLNHIGFHLVLERVAQFLNYSLLGGLSGLRGWSTLACSQLTSLILSQKFLQLRNFILVLLQQSIFRVLVHRRFVLNILRSARIS